VRSLLASYPIAIIFALLLHLALLWVLVVAQQSEPKLVQIKPKAIKASLVQIEKPKIKPKPVSPPKKQQAIKKPVEKKQAPPKAVAPEAKEKPKKEAPVDKELVKKTQEKKPSLEERLNELLAQQNQEIEEDETLEDVQRYSAAIQNEIYRRWSRPASARRDMELLLSIRLLPSGDIVGVTVKESSGNDALDRSAVNAVKRAQRFDFVREMDLKLFESYFRSFDLRFSPQDLRL